MSLSVLSVTCWPTIFPSGVTPMMTLPPSSLRNAQIVSAARLSCPVDFLNSTVLDSPSFAKCLMSLSLILVYSNTVPASDSSILHFCDKSGQNRSTFSISWAYFLGAFRSSTAISRLKVSPESRVPGLESRVRSHRNTWYDPRLETLDSRLHLNLLPLQLKGALCTRHIMHHGQHGLRQPGNRFFWKAYQPASSIP